MTELLHEPNNHVEDEIDLGEIFALLWHKKWLIMFVSISALILSKLYTDTLPDEYRAKATVLLNGQKNNAITSLIPGASDGNVDFDTSIKLLKSHRFLTRLERKLSIPLDLKENPDGQVWGAMDIERNLTITRVSSTNLLEISFESHDPNFSAQLVNAITVNFIDYQAQLLQPDVKNDGDWLKEKINHIQTQLREEEGLLNAFRQENNAIDISSLVKQGQHEISLLFAEQRKLVQERDLLQRLLSKVRKYKQDVNRIVSIKKISDIVTIRTLLNSLEQYKLELSQVKLRYLHKHPKYQSVSLKIDETKRQLFAQVNYQVQQYKARLSDVNYLLTAIGDKQQIAKRELEQSIVKVQEYEQISRNIKLNLELLQKLTARQKQLEIIDNKGTIASFIIIDPAQVPREPVGPKKTLIMMLAFLLGFIVAVFIVFILYFVSNHRNRYRQIVVNHGFDILGELPEVKIENANAPVLRGKGKRFLRYQEAINSIRTNYMIDNTLSDNRLIAITSLTPNEGKSSCCLQLTRSFSELEKVIIVDADLRAPSIAAVLGESPHRLGLSNLIAGTHTFEQCVFYNEELNADVLSSGIRPNNALLFLSSQRFEQLLKALLIKYDRVILECPPLLSVSDALVIGKSVKGVTLVADVTKNSTSKFMRDMHELQHTNIDISGIILNRTKVDNEQYYGAYSQQIKLNYGQVSR